MIESRRSERSEVRVSRFDCRSARDWRSSGELVDVEIVRIRRYDEKRCLVEERVVRTSLQ